MPDLPYLIVLSFTQIRDWGFYVAAIWRPARAFQMSRASWLDALTELYFYSDQGRIMLRSGRVFIVPEIDTVFTDPQNRWMSHFLKSDPGGTLPHTHCRALPKLRLIALYGQLKD